MSRPHEDAAPRTTSIWVAFLFFVCVSLAMIGPHILPPTEISHVGYADDDAYIFMWNFSWTKRSLQGLQNPYWTNLLNHPTGASLSFHSYPLSYSLLSVPLQVLLPGLGGLTVALNLVIFLSFVLSGFGAYLLALYVTESRSGALVAGLIFAFMPFHLLNAVNLHLLAIEVLPFYVLSMLRLARKPVLRRSLLLAVCLAIAYYTSLEYALYLLIFSFFWVVYQFAARRPSFTREYVSQLGLAAACFILLAGPLLWQQMRDATSAPFQVARSIEEAVHWSPALLSFVTPSRIQPVYGPSIAFMGEFGDGSAETWGMRSETALGFTALALVLASLIGLRRDERCFWALAALAFLTLTLGPYLRLTGTWLTGVPLPYLALYHLIPPLRAGRDPTRFLPVAMLMLSVLSAFGLRELLERSDRAGTRLLITTLFAALVLFEDLSAWPSKFQPSVHPLYTQIARTTGDFAVMDLTEDPKKLLRQTVHGRPITDGLGSVPRSGSRVLTLRLESHFRSPQAILSSEPSALPALIEELRQELERRRIRIVVFPDDAVAQQRVLLAQLLGARVTWERGLVLCDLQ